MMKRYLKLLPALLIVTQLSGCWDIRTIQDVNYFTGMGVDYSEGKWKLYVQQLDFGRVAKTQGGKSDTPAATWIGQGEGDTMDEAIGQIYRTSQQQVFWGHLSAIVLSDNLIRSGKVLELLDHLIRSREIRFTPWVYGTRSSIVDVLVTAPFFNLSPLNSILHMPEAGYKQLSEISPMRLQAFVRDLREPAGTALLPDLAIDDSTWLKNGQRDPKLKVDGVYPMRGSASAGMLPLSQLAGLRWMESGNVTARLELREKGKAVATLNVHPEDPKLSMRLVRGRPQFRVELKVRAELLGLLKPQHRLEMEALAEEAIRREVRELYEIGRKRDADPLKLDLALYRRNPSLWRKLSGSGTRPGVVSELGDVKVKVRLKTANMYKLNRTKPGP